MRKGSLDPIEAELIDELGILETLPDDRIDLVEMPERENWAGAVRGRFHTSVETAKSLPIDLDVLAYFEAQGPGYVTRMNRVLRASMLRDIRRRRVRI